MDFGKLYTKTETAEILRISITTLDRRMESGLIEYYKNGFHVLFDHKQIENYLSKIRNGSRVRKTHKNASAIQA